MTDEDLDRELKAAEAEAKQAEREFIGDSFDAEPVPIRQFRIPVKAGTTTSLITIDLRDLLACAFAASGVEPENIYQDADEALRFRG